MNQYLVNGDLSNMCIETVAAIQKDKDVTTEFVKSNLPSRLSILSSYYDSRGHLAKFYPEEHNMEHFLKDQDYRITCDGMLVCIFSSGEDIDLTGVQCWNIVAIVLKTSKVPKITNPDNVKLSLIISFSSVNIEVSDTLFYELTNIFSARINNLKLREVTYMSIESVDKNYLESIVGVGIHNIPQIENKDKIKSVVIQWQLTDEEVLMLEGLKNLKVLLFRIKPDNPKIFNNLKLKRVDVVSDGPVKLSDYPKVDKYKIASSSQMSKLLVDVELKELKVSMKIESIKFEYFPYNKLTINSYVFEMGDKMSRNKSARFTQ